MKIDLHCHTTASDGILKPVEIVRRAIKRKLLAIAITDHDTLDGINEAITFSRNQDIEIIAGIELSCFEEKIEDIHIIGLFIDSKNDKLKEITEYLRKMRYNQKEEIIKKLNKFNFEINLKEVLEEANGAVLGRPHISRVLCKKYYPRYTEKRIYEELIGNNKKCFVKQKKISMKEAISIIKEAGGVSIIAHPGILNKNMDFIIHKFLEYNGDGIEIEYPYEERGIFNKKTSSSIKRYLRKIANKEDLIISGGTDFHTDKDNINIGDYGITVDEFKKIKKRINIKNGKINDAKRI